MRRRNPRQDWLGFQGPSYGRRTVDDAIDALVGDYLGVALGGVDGVAVTGPAWRSGRVGVRVAEEVLPGMGRTRRPTAPWRHGTGFGFCNQRITLPSAGTAGA